jgi:hypothetical protein
LSVQLVDLLLVSLMALPVRLVNFMVEHLREKKDIGVLTSVGVDSAYYHLSLFFL